MRRRVLFPMTLWLGISGFCGCSQSPKLPDTVPFSGIVTLDGAPVEGALVNFENVASQKPGAFGMTDAKGEYKLSILSGRLTKEGAVAGDYKVSISRFVDEQGNRVKMDQPRTIPGRQMIPRRYSDPIQTVLTGKVEAKGGKQDFELTSKGGPPALRR